MNKKFMNFTFALPFEFLTQFYRCNHSWWISGFFYGCGNLLMYESMRSKETIQAHLFLTPWGKLCQKMDQFDSNFDVIQERRPPIYNAEDYILGLKKFSKLSGLQLYLESPLGIFINHMDTIWMFTHPF